MKTQEPIAKEALFNEVKGSLFEYLVARHLATRAGNEADFLRSLDPNYLAVLSQQDRMVRQFYPEMLGFLSQTSALAVEKLVTHLGEVPRSPVLTGKFSNSREAEEWQEADLLVQTKEGELPVSLKLNKMNSFVNTKSGGIKSFFTQYFSFVDPRIQQEFNLFVDREWERMASELHALHDLEWQGSFESWVREGRSELPGQQGEEGREILHRYYARISKDMHRILTHAQKQNPILFGESLLPLMGFGKRSILQLICFHDFKGTQALEVHIHAAADVADHLTAAVIGKESGVASVEVKAGRWTLQIRVKPMNKFTTTAIKINCSVKVES